MPGRDPGSRRVTGSSACGEGRSKAQRCAKHSVFSDNKRAGSPGREAKGVNTWPDRLEQPLLPQGEEEPATRPTSALGSGEAGLGWETRTRRPPQGPGKWSGLSPWDQAVGRHGKRGNFRHVSEVN